jgi:hypothetical protein
MKGPERGQAMVEYAVAVVVLALALFMPVLPDPDGQGRLAVLELFVRAFDVYIDSFHAVLMLPIP